METTVPIKGQRTNEITKSVQAGNVSLQDRALQTWLENGGTKADAMREVGYSESMALNPQKVFNTPYAMEKLAEAGVDLNGALKQLNRKVKSRRLDHMTFPPFNKEKHDKSINGIDSEELISDLNDEDIAKIDEFGSSINIGEKKGEQLTDDDIREMLADVNCVVRRIVHGEMARHVYFWTDNDKAQLDAIDKIINLYGLYAPKKTEQKTETIHKFSMAGLRKRALESGRDVIDVEITETITTTTETNGEDEPIQIESQPVGDALVNQVTTETQPMSAHGRIASMLESEN